MRAVDDGQRGPSAAGWRAAAVAAATGLVLVLGACGGAQPAATPSAAGPATPGTSSTGEPDPNASASTATPSGGTSASGSPAPSATASASPSATDADAVTVPITVQNGQVSPNGERVSVRVGQTVVLEVSSDEDDEIHAHTDGGGYALEVAAGKPVAGRFSIGSPGRYEVESHHLEKIIVILDVR